MASLVWEALKEAYAIPGGGPATVTEESLPDPEHTLVRLRLRKPDGHSFSGLMIWPRGERVVPCALLLHALSSDKETMIRLFGRPLAERGIGALALDAHLHGERQPPTAQPLQPLQYLDLARESVIEYRQALDYLETRSDVDRERLGLLGYSLGAMMGTILSGVDERVKACALLVGGDLVQTALPQLPGFLRAALGPVSPASFAPHISPRPVLFINGKWDTVVPREAAVALHQAAREPRQVIWVDAGHILPPEAAARGVDWLEQRLKVS
jgi:fermentation-respiration switch protein FrsA (DUF1100 family)